jgi:hypothetical protein
MDGSSACGFFDIILGLFVEADIRGSGKLVCTCFALKFGVVAHVISST